MIRAGFIGIIVSLSTAVSAPAAEESIELPRATLTQAIERALADNPGLLAADWQRRAAEYDVRERRGGAFPQVSASGSYTRYEEPTTVTPIHEAGSFPALDDRIYESAIRMSVPLLSGQVWAQTDAAKAAAAAARAEVRITRTELIDRITRLFIRANELEDNQRLLAAHLEALRQRRREMILLLEEGRASQADLALVDSSIDAAESDAMELESRWTELAYLLGQLMGADRPTLPAPFDLEENRELRMTEERDPGDVSPKVIRSQARVEQAEALRSAARRSFWPELGGFAGYTLRSGSDLDFSGEWAAGISLRIPLFEGGRRIAAIGAADASVRAAEELRRSVRIEEETRLNIAAGQWETARQRREALIRAVRNKETAVQAHRDRYDAGRIPLSELLSQETELLDLRSRERGLLYQEVLALVDYHAARGTLTVERVGEMTKE